MLHIEQHYNVLVNEAAGCPSSQSSNIVIEYNLLRLIHFELVGAHPGWNGVTIEMYWEETLGTVLTWVQGSFSGSSFFSERRDSTVQVGRDNGLGRTIWCCAIDESHECDVEYLTCIT